jgi:hypothetical protein
MSDAETEPKFTTAPERKAATDYPKHIETASNRALAVSPAPAEKPQIPVQVFQEMERRDENQILAEMRGELLEDLVYSVDIQGKRVTSLRYAGVKEGIRRRGNVEILEVRTEETPEEIRALVKVRDHDNRIDVLGASSAEKSKPFAYVLAVNKAERNAFAKLIPAKWYAVLIDEYLQRRKGKGTPERREGAETSKPVEEWHLKVPVTKDVVAIEGVKQQPLIQGTTSVGMLNVLTDGSEASIVPERPVDVDAAPIQRFLISKVLDAMKEKHVGFDYRLQVDDQGMLQAILIRGQLDDSQVKDLASASKWAFMHAMELQTPTQSHAESQNR